MGNIVIDIQANLNKLRSDLKQFFNKSFDVNVSGKGSSAGGGAKGGKGSGSVLGVLNKILMAVAPIAVLFKILDFFKVIELILNGVMLFLLQIWEWIKKIAKAVWDGLKVVWDLLKSLATAVWDGLKVVWDWLKKLFTAVWDGLKFVWNILSEIGKIIWNAIKFVWDIIKALWDVSKQGFKLVWDGLKKVWEMLTGFWSDKIQPILQGVWDVITGVWDSIKEIITSFFRDPVGTLKKALQFVWDAITSLPSKIWNFMKQLPKLIGDAIKGSLNFASRAGSWLADKGRGILGMNDGIIQKDGKIVRLNPNDTIFASKNPNGMGGGGTTVNLYGVTQREMLDYVKKELGKQINTVGRY